MLSSTPAALEQQVQVLTQLCRGADGMLQAEYVQLQQDLFAAAFQEVCRYGGVLCIHKLLNLCFVLQHCLFHIVEGSCGCAILHSEIWISLSCCSSRGT
jgi:hypothetical protein